MAEYSTNIRSTNHGFWIPLSSGPYNQDVGSSCLWGFSGPLYKCLQSRPTMFALLQPRSLVPSLFQTET